jgi:hypothetical protein
MRRRWFGLTGLLCFLLLATGARAQYQRPTPPADGGPPTSADLETYDGASRTLTVELLNLTPYDIQFTHNPGVSWSITAADEAAMQDTDPTSPKSFMFVPVGIPSLIPAAPAQDFLNPGDPGYDPNYVDTTTHPYPMVFSWDDRGGFKEDNWVTWTIKGVEFGCEANPPGCVPQTQDIQLGLWMYRNKPTLSLSSSFLPTLAGVLKASFGVVRIIVDPANPVAWAKEFLAIGKVGVKTYDWATANTQANDGNAMWVASYIIPNPKSPCVLSTTLICAPSTMTVETGDAVYSQWGASFAGPESANGTAAPVAAEADLIVSVHVFRGQRAKQCDPTLYPNKCPLGSEPVVMITVMRPTEFDVGALGGVAADSSTLTASNVHTDPVRLFLLQVGAGRIRQLLVKQGTVGLQLLRSVINGLTGDQRLVLRQMLRDMGSGRRPTLQERQVVHLIAAELQARLLEARKK